MVQPKFVGYRESDLIIRLYWSCLIPVSDASLVELFRVSGSLEAFQLIHQLAKQCVWSVRVLPSGNTHRH